MATVTIDPRVSGRTADFVQSNHRMLIDGRLVPAASGRTFPVYNPATGDVITHVPEAEAEDVDRAVRAARQAFDEGPWPRMSPSERGRILWKLGDLIEQNLEEFAELESIDNGKPTPLRAWLTFRLPWTCSATWPAGRPRFRARRCRCPRVTTSTPTRCANRSAWWRRSSPGTSRC